MLSATGLALLSVATERQHELLIDIALTSVQAQWLLAEAGE